MKPLRFIPLLFLICTGCATSFAQPMQRKEADRPETTLSYGQKFDPVAIDGQRGVSFSFILSGATSDWESLIEGESFHLRAGCLSYKSGNETADWYESAGVMTNGSRWDSLLSSASDDKLVSISLNPDCSVTYYLNGALIYTFVSNVFPSTYTSGKLLRIRHLYEEAIREISSAGFCIGQSDERATCTYSMRELTVGEGLDEASAMAYARTYRYASVRYVDSCGRDLISPQCYIGEEGDSFEISSPAIDGYFPRTPFVSGTVSGDEEFTVSYDFIGEERVTDEIKNAKENILDRSGSLGWSDPATWFRCADDLFGSFSLKIELNQKGAVSMLPTARAADIVWRTVLPITYDAQTGDRWVCRLDWYGWMDDGNGDGIQIGSEPSYNDSVCYAANFERDMYYIFSDCDLSIVFRRESSLLTMDCRIYPNHPLYRNTVYRYRCQLKSLTCDALNLALSAEDALITVNSIIY